MAFTQNEVRGTHLIFFKRGDFKVSCLKFCEWSCLLGEKFIFFKSLGTTKISRSFRLSVYIIIALLINFQEQFESYASASNIREVIKFYNLGDKTFETDFSFLMDFSRIIHGFSKHAVKQALGIKMWKR